MSFRSYRYGGDKALQLLLFAAAVGLAIGATLARVSMRRSALEKIHGRPVSLVDAFWAGP